LPIEAFEETLVLCRQNASAIRRGLWRNRTGPGKMFGWEPVNSTDINDIVRTAVLAHKSQPDGYPETPGEEENENFLRFNSRRTSSGS